MAACTQQTLLQARLSDTVSFILEAAARHPVLRHDRQLELSYRVRKWLDWPADSGPCPSAVEARGRRAKQRLMETNLRLVVSMAARYRHVWQRCPDVYSDLIQEGCFGLNRAIEKFDPTRGYCLSTYSIPWIRQSIGRSVPYITDTIRRPGHIHDQWRKLSRLITTYESEHGVRPSIEWLAQQSGLSEKEVCHTCVCGAMKVVSLDQPARNDFGADETTLGDLLADERSITPDEQLHQDSRLELAHQLIAQLPDKERQLIAGLYLEGANHAEYGAQIGVSRTRVGQLKLQALERMRGDHNPSTDEGYPARQCTVCGTTFTPAAAGRQVCSTDCRNERRRQCNRAYNARKKLQLIAA